MFLHEKRKRVREKVNFLKRKEEDEEERKRGRVVLLLK